VISFPLEKFRRAVQKILFQFSRFFKKMFLRKSRDVCAEYFVMQKSRVLQQQQQQQQQQY
jgi:hypothetical protein